MCSLLFVYLTSICLFVSVWVVVCFSYVFCFGFCVCVHLVGKRQSYVYALSYAWIQLSSCFTAVFISCSFEFVLFLSYHFLYIDYSAFNLEGDQYKWDVSYFRQQIYQTYRLKLFSYLWVDYHVMSFSIQYGRFRVSCMFPKIYILDKIRH